MKYICLDTETTGFLIKTDRIIEIGCVDITNNIHNANKFQQYINPLRDVPETARAIHGISTEFLKDFKTFEHYALDFLNFIENSTLIIHNASFDIRFLNAELSRINLPAITNPVIDTLKLAKEKFPGKKVSLDALKNIYNINIEREKHGALLDAEILAHIYLEMQKKQTFLEINKETNEEIQNISQKTKNVGKIKIEISDKELNMDKEFFKND